MSQNNKYGYKYTWYAGDCPQKPLLCIPNMSLKM